MVGGNHRTIDLEQSRSKGTTQSRLKLVWWNFLSLLFGHGHQSSHINHPLVNIRDYNDASLAYVLY